MNRENLAELRDELLAHRKFIEPRFNMEHICKSPLGQFSGPYEAKKQLTECGSTGCLLGWSAALGVGNEADIKDLRGTPRNVGWDIYYNKTFGGGSRLWNEVFSANLSSDIDEAVDRITRAIEARWDDEIEIKKEKFLMERYTFIHKARYRCYVNLTDPRGSLKIADLKEPESKPEIPIIDMVISKISGADLWPKTPKINVYWNGHFESEWTIAKYA